MNPLAMLKAMRPKQWSKNGLLFAALVFSERYADPAAVGRVLAGFALFSMLSSAGYIVNDIRDVDGDRAHPTKRNRPIAAGKVSIPAAWALASLLLVGGLAGSMWLGRGFAIAALSYLAVTLSYSTWFKHAVLLDVMLIAAGFLIRAVAGAETIPVASSPWFLLCTAFGALFIAMGKRLAEIRLLEDAAGAHRKILEEYSIPLLERWISIMTACTLISYALYTFHGGHGRALMLTLPCVIYGVLRYLYLVDKGDGGAPDQTLLRDRPLQACIVIFVVVAVCAMRFGDGLGLS